MMTRSTATMVTFRHSFTVSKVEGFTVKQKRAHFNPKELAVDMSVPWKQQQPPRRSLRTP